MKGDFTRDSFDSTKHFSRVLSQQGRVTLDADANEQGAILLRTLRLMARDLIGPHAAPREEGGFRITPGGQGGFTISAGRYYVDGILIENDVDCAYTAQPDWPVPDDDPLAAELKAPSGLMYWLYLDVWERLVTGVEDPTIVEVALGGPDTCARAKVVWQVKGLKVDQNAIGGYRAYGRTHACNEPLAQLPGLSEAGLAARLDPGEADDDPCVIPPDSRYRGAENQLYRVEIHKGGAAGVATFKWARDNGSRLTAWSSAGEDADSLAVADSRGFEAGNWVEIGDDLGDLRGAPGNLVRLASVAPGTLDVDAASIGAGVSLTWTPQLPNPKVRRWDQVPKGDLQLVDGALPVREGTAAAPLWLDLEDGVQIAFAPGGTYRSGDYWLIPARVATSGLLWPEAAAADGAIEPATLPPHGVEHHYAPLGFLSLGGGQSKGPQFESCRCVFDPGSDCLSQGSLAVGASQLRNPPSRVVEQPVTRPLDRPVTRPPQPTRPPRTRTPPTRSEPRPGGGGMRAVWSFWSKPYRSGRRESWASDWHHWLAWGLSAHAARQHYPDTALVTDDAGARILVDLLELPFTQVSTGLNRLEGADPEWWALGKIESYRHQTAPFVHIDTDVFLWKPLRPELETADVLAQNPEPILAPDTCYRPDLLEEAVKADGPGWLPREWRWYRRAGGTKRAECCGVFGGARVDFIQHYAALALKLAADPRNRAGLKSLRGKSGHMILLEQYLLSACLDYHADHAASPFRDVKIGYVFDGIEQLYEPGPAADAGYTHLAAGTKQNRQVCRDLERRVAEELPHYYARCHDRAHAIPGILAA